MDHTTNKLAALLRT